MSPAAYARALTVEALASMSSFAAMGKSVVMVEFSR